MSEWFARNFYFFDCFQFEEQRQLKSSGLQANRNIGDMIADGISYFVGFIQQFYKIISKFVPLFNMII